MCRYRTKNRKSILLCSKQQTVSLAASLFFLAVFVAQIRQQRVVLGTLNEVEGLNLSNRSLPVEEEGPVSWKNTNTSISVCLFMMDDRIKLMEWIAYHYTVLPFDKLMVGIDPKSKQFRLVRQILKRWGTRVDYQVVFNSTYVPWKNPLSGWGYQGDIQEWLRTANESDIQTKRHKRNERAFYLYCLRSMIKSNKTWVWIGDTDEYVLPNYIGPNENATRYDGYTSMIEPDRKQFIDSERQRILPIRRSLPPFSSRVTVSDILHQTLPYHADLEHPGCIRFPDLRFTGYESRDAVASLPAGVNPFHLTSLRHRRHTFKEGGFSKAFVNVGTLTSIPDRQFDTVHKPLRNICSQWISGVDYLSSILRFNHYKTGTLESLLERGQSDFRFNNPVDFFQERNMEPVGQCSDIVGWVNWFIEKVGGMEEARFLLFGPINESYAELDTSNYSDFLKSLW